MENYYETLQMCILKYPSGHPTMLTKANEEITTDFEILAYHETDTLTRLQADDDRTYTITNKKRYLIYFRLLPLCFRDDSHRTESLYVMKKLRLNIDYD